MARKSVQLATLGLEILAVLCWLVMFLAGTDVWHDVGRPDFWNLAGPPYQDLRAFVDAFYVLFGVLSAHLIVTAVDFSSTRAGTSRPD
jgi:hypothetical protein